MKRICTNCGQVAPQGITWCQNVDCHAGSLTTILDYGESLGNIEVQRLLRVFRASAVYEARRGKENVLLKVAHDNCKEQLKNEVKALARLHDNAHPALPVLLSPTLSEEITETSYGKTAFRDETKYYSVLKYAKGDFLRDMLTKNPQPWYQHVAWMIIPIAEAIYLMHAKTGKLHLNINPETILVRVDGKGIPRPLLLDLGAAIEPQGITSDWVEKWALPAYTAPELLSHSKVIGPTADVYGLGLLMYEMLAGHPAFRFNLVKDEDVRSAVLKTTIEPLNRVDLTKDVTKIVEQAVSKNPASRQQDVKTFISTLQTQVGDVPAEKKGIQLLTRRQMAIGLSSIALLVVLIVLGIILQNAHIF